MNIEQERKMRNNWRGRRYIACTAMSQIRGVIESLGEEDGSEILPEGFESVASDQIKNELINQANTLLRMIILLNDGSISDSKLNAF